MHTGQDELCDPKVLCIIGNYMIVYIHDCVYNWKSYNHISCIPHIYGTDIWHSYRLVYFVNLAVVACKCVAANVGDSEYLGLPLSKQYLICQHAIIR